MSDTESVHNLLCPWSLFLQMVLYEFRRKHQETSLF
jgi:hypothetical protein